MDTSNVIMLLGLVIGIPTGMWVIYQAMDAKLEIIRGNIHKNAGAAQDAVRSIDDDIRNLTDRISRVEGRLNGAKAKA